MNSTILNRLATIVLVIGIIALCGLFQPIVFPKVATGEILGSIVYDNQFNYIGLIYWCLSGLGFYVVYAILKALTIILNKLC